jgi:chromosome segregation ATPase
MILLRFRRTFLTLFIGALLACAPAWAEGDLPLVEPAKSAHQWGDSPFNTQGIVTFAGLIASVLAIITYFEKKRIRTEEAAKRTAAELEARMSAAADDREKAAQARHSELITEQRRHNDAIEVRISSLEKAQAGTEVKLQDFVPKGEIDRRFEHVSTNMKQASEAAANSIRRLDEALGGTRERVATLDAKLDGVGSGVQGLEKRVEQMSTQINAKLDVLADRVAGR